jgi:hypothetical protein
MVEEALHPVGGRARTGEEILKRRSEERTFSGMFSAAHAESSSWEEAGEVGEFGDEG